MKRCIIKKKIKNRVVLLLFGGNGNVTFDLLKRNNMQISNLQKQAKAAPKFILKLDGLDLYLADKQNLSGVNLTANIKKAMKYSAGFDDVDTKIKVWNKTAALQCNNQDVKFEAVYL